MIKLSTFYSKCFADMQPGVGRLTKLMKRKQKKGLLPPPGRASAPSASPPSGSGG